MGNPDVGEVHFKGKLTTISRLQCAENEAKMIAEKLAVNVNEALKTLSAGNTNKSKMYHVPRQ